MKNLTIYIDMDGVVANFDKAVKAMQHIYEQPWLDIPNFFLNLEPIGNPNARIEELQQLGYKVYILTKVDISDGPERAINKYDWVSRHIPCISKDEVIIVPIDKEKTKYLRSDIKDSVLLDDYKGNLNDWTNKGGIAVKFGNKYKATRKYHQIVLDIGNLKNLLSDIEAI